MKLRRNVFWATVAAVSLPMARSEVYPGPPINQQKVEIVTDAFNGMKSYWIAKGVGMSSVKLKFLRENEHACHHSGNSRSILGLYCDGNVFMTSKGLEMLENKNAGFTNAATFVVAHELGHAVQDAEHIRNDSHDWNELQASCLAGTAMQAVFPDRIPREEFASRRDLEARLFLLATRGADCIHKGGVG